MSHFARKPISLPLVALLAGLFLATASFAAGELPEVEAVTNPYGLDALWKGGDMVARSTLVILLLMSMGSWFVIATKLLEFFKLGRQARDAGQAFSGSAGVDKGVSTLKADNIFAFVAKSAIDAASRHGRLAGHVDLNSWIGTSLQRSVDKIGSRSQRGLSLLATVGSTAPFVGLFGTVWGIYHALTAIGIAGQASIDKVAGPVGEALIMTAIGLAVAVPAVLGYNFLVRSNKTTMERVRTFAADIHAMLLGDTADAPVA